MQDGIKQIITMSFMDAMPDYSQMGLPMPIDMKQLPIFSYPMFPACLGLIPEEPHIEFMEGYVKAAFDFTVKQATESCVFDVLTDTEGIFDKESLEERLLNRKLKAPSFVKKGTKGATKKLNAAKKKAKKVQDTLDQFGVTDKLGDAMDLGPAKKLKEEFIKGMNK